MENLASLRSLDATGGPSGTGRPTTSHPLERARPARGFEEDLASARRSERREERRERNVEQRERRSEAERAQERSESRRAGAEGAETAPEEAIEARLEADLLPEAALEPTSEESSAAQEPEPGGQVARGEAENEVQGLPTAKGIPTTSGAAARGAGAAVEALAASNPALPSPRTAPTPEPAGSEGQSDAPLRPATPSTTQAETRSGDRDGQSPPPSARPEAVEPSTQPQRGEAAAGPRAEVSLATPESRPAPAPVAPAAAAGAQPGAPAPQPEASEYAAAILRQVRLRFSPHTREATLQLEPARLGRLAIRLELRQGVTRAEVVAEEQSTFEVLGRYLPELREALGAAGFEGVEVDLRHAGEGSTDTPFTPRGKGARAQSPAAIEQAPAALTRTLATRFENTGGVDTYA